MIRATALEYDFAGDCKRKGKYQLKNELFDDNRKAVELDCQIKKTALDAQKNLYDMAMGLKEMRDSKLYKKLGYSEFNDYCQMTLGFTDRKGYKLISIVEKLPKDLVNTCSLNSTSKLYLLSTLSDDDREEIVESNDLENTSVRELERQIKQLKSEKETANIKLDEVNRENIRVAQQRDELMNRISEKDKRIKELENRPIDVAAQVVERIPDNCIALSAYEKKVCECNERIEENDRENLELLRKEHAEKVELEEKLTAEIRELKAQLESGTPQIDLWVIAMPVDDMADLQEQTRGSKIGEELRKARKIRL